MEAAKGIPTGAPVLDPAAVFTPPTIGPRDYSHMWAAATLRGTDGPVRELPDITGTTPLATGTTGVRFVDGPCPVVTIAAGADRMSAPGQAPPTGQTVLLVARLAAAKSAQIGVPGWVIGGGATGKLTVSGTTTASFQSSPPARLAVYLLTLTAGRVTASIDGTSAGPDLALQPSASTRYTLGTNVYSSDVSEEYALLKVWPRVLTAEEQAQALTDARTALTLTV
ncbi:hypothetical protein [Arthrobacter sp. UM1]|uniref:hypothetical protein n=1 Tax=Arthrobacter sp. UM1 TaxID=2766776 RepID=UPI001CF619EE|nr:hypothetical protein [Arthrobacter sp. UM1]MCB4209158.1 hypothetical protein [Arthrobacter sp. UM1]